MCGNWIAWYLGQGNSTPQFISGTDSSIELYKNRRACVQCERSGSVVWMRWCQPSISLFIREGTITLVLLVWISIHLILQLVGFFSCRVRRSWLVEYGSWWCMKGETKIDFCLLAHFSWTWAWERQLGGWLSISQSIHQLHHYHFICKKVISHNLQKYVCIEIYWDEFLDSDFL